MKYTSWDRTQKDLFERSGTIPRAETSLHAALKDLYTGDGARQEIWVDGYWIDVVTPDELIEIQTRHFGALRAKLTDLLRRQRVRLVHPIALETWIVHLADGDLSNTSSSTYPERGSHVTDALTALSMAKNAVDAAAPTGGVDVAGVVPATAGKPVLRRRKSPRRGRLEDLFWELVRLPELTMHPNFSLEVLLIREEQRRQHDGRGSWRRGGVSIADRVLLEVVERRLFTAPQDYLALLPTGLPEAFSNAHLAAGLKISPKLAAKMSYCLRLAGLIRQSGMEKRCRLHSIIGQG